MVFIAYSTVRIVFNIYRWYHVAIVSGFLITQAVFGLCIVTSLEGIIRASEGFVAPSNYFILHSMLNPQLEVIARVIFLTLGIALLFLIKRRRTVSVS